MAGEETTTIEQLDAQLVQIHQELRTALDRVGAELPTDADGNEVIDGLLKSVDANPELRSLALRLATLQVTREVLIAGQQS